jgi:quercetin dioxygenase-like cupin family protein
MRSLLLAAVFACIATSSVAAQAAQAGKSDAPQATIAMPDNIKWGPAPAILPAGAKAAILEGNPAEAGPFTLRLSLPPGYRIAPHYHPVPEHVTVISGAFYVGMGESFDAAKTTKLPAGTFGVLPPDMRHFAMTKGRTVIQLHGVGPWSLVYVNPADDPRTKTK